MEKIVLIDQNKKNPRAILKCNFMIKILPVDQDNSFIKEKYIPALNQDLN